ncbi:unnamed protein product [Vitrella brassicaformis CCMP3155]|uniref:Zinc finger PHD-type domain-containing protein n=1 Tax=Vitrella brassicaformis (strain CCMP3155) TaxID=1169540 RepID=A0A0G4GJL8_VITBC|nr:unnamed protein product [Vitrella brassicaformis CCMP3155]|eukprot:CEM30112.1 unnamed protein product [Vitrella brassicaformis CCMP3155]
MEATGSSSSRQEASGGARLPLAIAPRGSDELQPSVKDDLFQEVSESDSLIQFEACLSDELVPSEPPHPKKLFRWTSEMVDHSHFIRHLKHPSPTLLARLPPFPTPFLHKGTLRRQIVPVTKDENPPPPNNHTRARARDGRYIPMDGGNGNNGGGVEGGGGGAGAVRRDRRGGGGNKRHRREGENRGNRGNSGAVHQPQPQQLGGGGGGQRRSICVCGRRVQSLSIRCDECRVWHHPACAEVAPKGTVEIRRWPRARAFFCPQCREGDDPTKKKVSKALSEENDDSDNMIVEKDKEGDNNQGTPDMQSDQ